MFLVPRMGLHFAGRREGERSERGQRREREEKRERERLFLERVDTMM